MMKKLSDFYTEDYPSGSKVATDMALHSAVVAGTKKLLCSSNEYAWILEMYSLQIPATANVASGQFKFWGTTLVREEKKLKVKHVT